jgi:murein DD-endopeptidase MepM/ murein hydrolase activator NlpD
MAGLALPTAAAAALTFTATGAAFAGKTQATAFGHSGGPQASSAATLSSANAALKAVEDKALAKARADSVVARAAERKNLAARALAAKRAAEAHAWQLPITNPVRSSPFGYRWGRLHAGEDFAVSEGTNLASMSTGTVIFAGQESGYGNLVKIRYWDGTISYYGHMSHLSVTAGESVEPGEVVGRSGNTGHSTGPHLHLEIHPDGGAAIDPLPWLAAHHIAS